MPTLEVVRRQKLLSQRDLAERAGVSLTTVFQIENGKVQPRLKSMRQLCAALEVQPQDVDEFRAALNMDNSSAC